MQETGGTCCGFLKGAVVSGTAAAAGAAAVVTPLTAAAQAASPALTPAADTPPGYVVLTPGEAVFIEAVADHLHPGDAKSLDGVAIGINIFIDRAPTVEMRTYSWVTRVVTDDTKRTARIVGSQGCRLAGLPVLGAAEARRHRPDDRGPEQAHRRPASDGARQAHAPLGHARSQAARRAHPVPGDLEVAGWRRSFESACTGL